MEAGSLYPALQRLELQGLVTARWDEGAGKRRTRIYRLTAAGRKRLHAEVCQDCWGVWLQRQTALINHYGLNLRDPEARKFLADQTQEFFFGSGESESVDTSKQGTISW